MKKFWTSIVDDGMGGNDGLNLYTAAMRKPARVKRNKAATEAPGKGASRRFFV